MTREAFNQMIKQIQSKVDQEFNVISEADLQAIVEEFGVDDKAYVALKDYLDSKKIIIEEEEKDISVSLDDLEQEMDLDKNSHINKIVDDSNKNYSRLYQIIQRFARENNINLTKIESRPSKAGLGKYIFFVDFNGHVNDVVIQNIIDEIEKNTYFFKVLGSYPEY